MFDVAEDGRLTGSCIFANGIRDTLKASLPDGMKADSQGNVWVTAPGGVWVYSFEGRLLGQIEVSEMVANLHWGDADWQTLYMCATTSLYSVRTKVKGRQEPFMQAKAAARSSTVERAATAGASALAPIDPARTALLIQDL